VDVDVTNRTAVVHDPHPLWLEAVRDVLARVDVDVVAATTDDGEAAELVRRLRPDLVVTALAALAAQLSSTRSKVVVVAESAAPLAVASAFAAGASAYVLKTAHPDDLATAVRQAFAQTVYTVSRASTPAATAALDRLTPREREILALVAEGRSNADVARLLWVSRQTVKFHLAGAYRKLGVANRTEAARWAHEHGLVAAASTAAA
jgi:DNA-binding NarL/FixJ family response regulator